MDKSSSISRSNSRSSLDDSSESSQDNAPPSDAGKGQPNIQPARKRAGTWTSAPIPTSPRGTQEKSSAPVLRRGLQRLATVSAAVPGDHSDDTRRAPTTSDTAKTALPPTMSETTATAATASTLVATPVPMAKTVATTKSQSESGSALRWSALPEKIKSVIRAGMQSEAKLKGKALGQLLVCVESGAGTKKPAATKGGAPILRGGQMIRGYDGGGGTPGTPMDINVIERFLIPFLGTHLDTPELEEARKKVQRNYEAMHRKLREYDTTSLRPVQVLELEGYKELMTQVIKPLTDYLLGPSMDLKSSGLSGRMKELLLSIDAAMVTWIKDKGPAKLEDQYLLRRSALVSILAIRGISFLWKTAFSEVKKEDAQFFLPLNVFFNAFLNHKLDRLYLLVMLENGEQSNEIKALLKGRALREKQQMNVVQTPRGKDDSFAGKIGRLFSPRTAETAPVPVSPRDASVMVKSIKESEARKVNLERKRAAALDEFTKEMRLADFSPEFLKQMKSRVTGSREEFRLFKEAPAKYCLARIMAYAEKLNAENKPVPANYPVFLAKLKKWAAEEAADEVSAEQPARQMLRADTTSSNRSSASQTATGSATKPQDADSSTTGPTTFSSSASMTLDLSALKKSPFDEEDSSTETEPGDSPGTKTESGSAESPRQ